MEDQQTSVWQVLTLTMPPCIFDTSRKRLASKKNGYLNRIYSSAVERESKMIIEFVVLLMLQK